MVEHLGRNVATAAERRDHEQRHAHAEPERPVDVERLRVRLTCRELAGGQVLAGGALRRGRRCHVIEPAVVLVVHDEQRRLGPDLGVRRQLAEHHRDEPLAVGRRGRWMLVEAERRDDPGDLGELARLHVGGEVVGEGLLEGLLEQRRARLAEGREVAQDVVGQRKARGLDRVVEVRAPGQVLAQRGEPAADADVARRIDLPRNALVLEQFLNGRPGAAPDRVGGRVGGDHRAAVATCGIDRAARRHQPVGVGGAEDRGVEGIPSVKWSASAQWNGSCGRE